MKKGLFDKFREMAADVADEYQKRNGGKSILEEVLDKSKKDSEPTAPEEESKKKGGGLFDKWFGDDDDKRTAQDEENELERKIKDFDGRNEDDDFDEEERQKDVAEQIDILEEKFEDILEELVAKHRAIREKLADEHNRREVEMAKKLQARLDRMKDELA